MFFESRANQVRLYQCFDIIIPFLIIVEVLKFVHCYDYLSDAQAAGQQGMLLSRCSITFPSAFKLTQLTINHQHGAISLSGSRDHISDKVSMTGRVKDSKVAIWGREIARCHFNCDSSLLLFLSFVHDISKLEACLVINLCFALVCSELLPCHMTILEEDLA